MKNFADFEKALAKGLATWWQMELPSGDVIFGSVKAEMLGYSESKFSNYKDFTSLVHSDDYDTMMKDMRDHLEGKKEFYETSYRIKNSKGEYIRFYDIGKILDIDKDNITVIGFVWKMDMNEDYKKQMKNFKELIIEGKPSIIEMFNKINK